MYPRAAAYIISVKQSTYCQFGKVIRAHTERKEGERAGTAGWREGGGKREKRDKRWLKRLENEQKHMTKKQQKMELESTLKMSFKK